MAKNTCVLSDHTCLRLPAPLLWQDVYLNRSFLDVVASPALSKEPFGSHFSGSIWITRMLMNLWSSKSAVMIYIFNKVYLITFPLWPQFRFKQLHGFDAFVVSQVNYQSPVDPRSISVVHLVTRADIKMTERLRSFAGISICWSL